MRAVSRERNYWLSRHAPPNQPVSHIGRVQGKSLQRPIWAIEGLARGTKRSWLSSERSGRREMAEEGKRTRSRKYLGAWPICERCINVRTLSCIRAMNRSQWRWSNMKAELWDVRGSRAIGLAAEFRTHWRGERRTFGFGRPTRRELQ